MQLRTAVMKHQARCVNISDRVSRLYSLSTACISYHFSRSISHCLSDWLMQPKFVIVSQICQLDVIAHCHWIRPYAINGRRLYLFAVLPLLLPQEVQRSLYQFPAFGRHTEIPPTAHFFVQRSTESSDLCPSHPTRWRCWREPRTQTNVPMRSMRRQCRAKCHTVHRMWQVVSQTLHPRRKTASSGKQLEMSKMWRPATNTPSVAESTPQNSSPSSKEGTHWPPYRVPGHAQT